VRLLLPWLGWPETKWAIVAVLINSLSKKFLTGEQSAPHGREASANFRWVLKKLGD